MRSHGSWPLGGRGRSVGRSRQELTREGAPPRVRRSRRAYLPVGNRTRVGPRVRRGLLVIGAAGAAQRQYHHARGQRTCEFSDQYFTQTSSPTAKVVSAVTPAVVLTRSDVGWLGA